MHCLNRSVHTKCLSKIYVLSIITILISDGLFRVY